MVSKYAFETVYDDDVIRSNGFFIYSTILLLFEFGKTYIVNQKRGVFAHASAHM